MDILDCFPNQQTMKHESRDNFNQWASKQDDVWWNRIYQHIYQRMSIELFNLLFQKPVFLFGRNTDRQYLPSLNHTCARIYLSDKFAEFMWKRQIILLRTTSVYERDALLESSRVQLLTDELLIEIIHYDHMQILGSSRTSKEISVSIEEIWGDLIFLKSKMHLIHCTDHFLVPVNGSNSFSPIQDVTLPTILGCNIQNLIHSSDTPTIRLPYPFNTRDHSLEWENFFLLMNCKKPELYDHTSYAPSELPIIPPLAEYTDPMLAESIFMKQLHLTQECIRNFPTSARLNRLEKFYPISATFDRNLTHDLSYLPDIAVPVEYRSFAESLGVTCKFDFRIGVKVLKILASQKNEDCFLYIHWLNHLRRYFYQKNDEDKLMTDTLSDCEIYLNNIEKYRTLKDLVIVEENDDHRDSILIIARYLNLPIISSTVNEVYWQLKDFFVKHKLAYQMNISVIIRTIQLASKNKNNFYPFADGMTILKENAIEEFLKLYQYMEHLLGEQVLNGETENMVLKNANEIRNSAARCGSREHLQWRFSLLEKENSNTLESFLGLDQLDEPLPLITHNNKITTQSFFENIYACMEERIIRNLSSTTSRRSFVLPKLTATCPLILAALNIDYVERRGTICWFHKNNSSERVLKNITEIFRNLLDDPALYVVNSGFPSVVILLSDLFVINIDHGSVQNRSTSYIDDSIPKNVDSYPIDTYFQFWIFDKIVNLNLHGKDDDRTKTKVALHALITLLNKRKFISVDKARVLINEKITQRLSFAEGEYAPFASSGASYYSFEDLVFPIPDTDCHLEKIIDQFTPNSSTRYVRTAMCRRKIIDYRELIEIGERAENFFFNHLKDLYEDHGITHKNNWRSSSRLKFFEGDNQGIDDTIGYDFELDDIRQKFVKGNGACTRKCYFEVKGVKGSFDKDTTLFHVSRNERSFCESIYHDTERKTREAYFLVIIENCLDPNSIQLATSIHWYVRFFT